MVAWYAGAVAVLTLVQVPWLDDFARFYLTNPAAIETIPGMSVRVLGTVPWLVIMAVVVGFIVFALFMPLLTMMQTMRGR